MADLDAYPAFGNLLETVPEYLDDIAVDRAVSGAARGRGFYDARKARFTVQHMLTQAELATLMALYDANRHLRVTYTYAPAGATPANYVCFFEGPPKVAFITPVQMRVTVTLAEQ